MQRRLARELQGQGRLFCEKQSRAEHGDKRAGLLKREHVNVMFARRATTRFAARNWLKTVRALMQFAVAEVAAILASQ